MTQAQSYEAWRITYQSDEQAARSAFDTAEMLRQELLMARAAITSLERDVSQALTERDDATDFIDKILDEVLGQDRHEWTSAYDWDDALADVEVKMAALKSGKCLHQIAEPAAVHPDDVAVDALAALMKAKLAKQRGKGYSGWDTDCTQEHLSNLLRSHVNKGDPVDVANFCAFLAARGEMICLTDAELINAMETRRAAEPQRLLAATQPAAQPVATITGLDEFGPLLGWHEHWAKFPVGTNFYTQPAAQGMDATVLMGYMHPGNFHPHQHARWKTGAPCALRLNGWTGEPLQVAVYAKQTDVDAALAAQAKQGGA